MPTDKIQVKQDQENPNYLIIGIILMFYVITVLTSL
jgi:hypothetical protein